jgi:hypothetical protein
MTSKNQGKQQNGSESPQKGYKIPAVEIKDHDLENIMQEFANRNKGDQRNITFQTKRMSLNQRLNATREARMLENFDKYQKIWKEQSQKHLE